MDSLSKALLNGADPGEIGRHELPPEYEAAHILASGVGMFDGVEDKDVRKSLHVGRVPMPEIVPDEVVVAVMASSINDNTVWSATFEPVPTFEFLRRKARDGGYAARHDLPHQVVGSDASGVVVRVGIGVRHCKVGDHVVAGSVQVDEQEPATPADAMLSSGQRIWCYETNFGGLAHYSVMRASRLLPEPGHLTWEESAGVLLTAAASYRMLVSDNGARIKQGGVVLIWGAAGGLGAFAVQMVKNAGGVAVGVVGSEHKADVLRRLVCDVVINSNEIGMGGDEAPTPERTIEVGMRLGRDVRRQVGEDPHVVFDCVGRATVGISVFVVRKGGVVVTCGSSTGYDHHFGNRYLWMNLKRVIGSHAANLQEQAECNRLFRLGHLSPILSKAFPPKEAGEAARLVQLNRRTGKVGVPCPAPEEGLGVTDPVLSEKIGVARLNPLRDVGSRVTAGVS